MNLSCSSKDIPAHPYGIWRNHWLPKESIMIYLSFSHFCESHSCSHSYHGSGDKRVSFCALTVLMCTSAHPISLSARATKGVGQPQLSLMVPWWDCPGTMRSAVQSTARCSGTSALRSCSLPFPGPPPRHPYLSDDSQLPVLQLPKLGGGVGVGAGRGALVMGLLSSILTIVCILGSPFVFSKQRRRTLEQ